MTEEDKPSEPTLEELLKALSASVAAGFSELHADIGEVRADLGLLSNDLGIVKVRVSALEGRIGPVEDRINRNSDRARSFGTQVSSTDMAQEKKIADEIIARELLAKQVEQLAESNDVQLAILKRLDEVAKNPTVKLVLAITGTVVAGWLAQRGIR